MEQKGGTVKDAKKRILLYGLFFLLLFLWSAGPVWAIDLGSDITIWDRMGVTHEDEEVEPGNIDSQEWDLEGFFQNGDLLYVVGGFDFWNGVDDPYYSAGSTYRDETYYSGDIFLDVDGDAVYGPDASGTGGDKTGLDSIQNTFGYDYVIDVDFSTELYSVYSLDPDTTVLQVWFDENDESNPWRYSDGGTLLSSGHSFAHSETGLYDSDVGFAGDENGVASHNAFAVSLAFLKGQGEYGDFWSHFTYGCGNDNLMGKGHVAPEPTTMLLVGVGLIGLGAVARRRGDKLN